MLEAISPSRSASDEVASRAAGHSDEDRAVRVTASAARELMSESRSLLSKIKLPQSAKTGGCGKADHQAKAPLQTSGHGHGLGIQLFCHRYRHRYGYEATCYHRNISRAST